MKYQLLSTLVFLNIVITTNAMEAKPKNPKNKIRNIIKIRSLSEGSMNLENLRQPIDSPTSKQRISPKTDEVIQEQEKNNAIPHRISSPRLAIAKAINEKINNGDNETEIILHDNK